MNDASATSAKVKAIPDRMHSVTPHLVCAGVADAIAFYEKACGADRSWPSRHSDE